MGKKRASRQKPLATMEDEFKVPKAVQNAADDYVMLLKEKRKATDNCASAKEKLMQAMDDKDLKQVRVITDDGVKIIKYELDPNVRFKKPEEPADSKDAAA